MLLFLCKLFESQKLGFYKTQGWEKKSGFLRARVRVSMCAPTHIRTHRHTAVPAHSILNWLNTPRQAQGLQQSNFGLSSPRQWRINDFYKNSPSKIWLFHAKSLILQRSKCLHGMITASLQEGALIISTSFEYNKNYIRITAPSRWIGNYLRRFCEEP